MAEVIDSPVSQRQSIVGAGLDLDVALPNVKSPASHSTRSGGGGKDESDVFDFHDSDDDGDQGDNHQEDEQAFYQRRQQGVNEIASLLIDQSSQQSGLSHKTHQSQHSHSQSQAMSEMLTQNADFTQMTQDDNDAGLSLSPFPLSSPMKPQQLPWGRLMPCHGAKAVDLLPKGPEGGGDQPSGLAQAAQQQQQQSGPHFSLLGLEQLRPSDVFNVYSLGRSAKNELVSPKPNQAAEEKEQRLQEWAYGLISNKHCRIYCTLPEDPRAATMPGSNSLPAASMEVWVEDASNNGTMVNQTILLKRGQKRRLHSGDEISLVNPETLRKRIRDDARLQNILQQHSFVFVNVAHQQQQQKQQPAKRHADPLGQSLGSLGSFPIAGPTSSAKRRKGLVNVRAMKYTGIRGPTPIRSPVPAPNRALHPLGLPTPKSGNVHHNHNQKESSSVAVSNRGRRRVSSSMVAAPLEAASPRRIEQDYDIRDLLGRGTCGEVRRAIHRLSGKERAVKIISLPPPGLVNQKQQQEAQQWQAEARILQTLDHPYVVQLVDVFCTDTHLYLVMELCAGGDLFDRIIQTKKYTEYDARRVMRRLLCAMHYIHEDCQLVHRDIKPENILLTGANDPCDVKITDFGVAKSASSELKTFCGTPLYFAPEVLKRRHTVHGQGRYGKAADVWSLGVILYILLSGTPPYNIDGASGMDVILKSSVKIPFHPQNWASISAAAVDLIQKMLVKDPRKRITIREACEHPWILTEDGDTHRHPLEDPKLISVTRKRLFPAGSPMPTPLTTGASPGNSPTKRRRKVSMESSVKMSEGKVVESKGKSDAKKEKEGLLDVTMDESEGAQPLSPVENKCSRPADVSPDITPAAGANQSKPLLGVIDENSSTTDVAKTLEASPEKPEGKEIKLPDKSSPQKLSPKLAESLKASIFSGVETAAGPGRTVSAIKAPAPLKENAGVLSNASTREGEGEKQDDLTNKAEQRKKTRAVPKSKRRSKKGKDEDLVIAAELDDDEICSQFSDDEETENISASKPAAIPEEKEVTATNNDSSKKMTQLTLAPLPDAAAANKTKNSSTKPKAKKVGGAAKNIKPAEGKSQGASAQAAGKGSKQMTLKELWKK